MDWGWVFVVGEPPSAALPSYSSYQPTQQLQREGAILQPETFMEVLEDYFPIQGLAMALHQLVAGTHDGEGGGAHN